MIKREDMLELTRRMNDSRAHIARVAGAYLDDEGYIDGTFNTNFLNIHGEEKKRVLEIAKSIPFSRTNEELVQYKVPGLRPGTVWQLLYALRDCELKNDALLLSLYEYIGERRITGMPYAVYVYYGTYDIPVKAADHTLGESEEIYRYLIVALCPLNEKQEAVMPDAGFLYPVLTDRSTDINHVNIYSRNEDRTEAETLKEILLLA